MIDEKKLQDKTDKNKEKDKSKKDEMSMRKLEEKYLSKLFV